MNRFQAVEKQNRLEVADALRGLALAGILLANIPFLADNNDLYGPRNFLIGSAGTDSFLKIVAQLFIDKKFITIFSMLFGFGFYIQFQRAKETGLAFGPYYFRRMLLLLLIGCIHAYLFWFGDIIRDYAICGICLLLVYKWPAKRILITGILFTVVLTGLIFIANGALGIEYRYDRAIVAEHPVATSYLRYLYINATIDPLVNFIQDSPITLVFCFGNMLIGFWLGKKSFFHKPGQFRFTRRKLMLIGSIAGVSCSYLFMMVMTGKLELTPVLIWLPLIIVAGMVLQSLFYISLFISLFQFKGWRKILSPFAVVGKMALTNYILQTFFYLFVFFYWTNGLRLYGRISLAETWITGLLFFTLQVLFSRWWMKRYEQGPVEYIWKKLAYHFSGSSTVRISSVQ